MAVCSWNLVKSDLSSVHVYSSIHWTSHVLQGTIPDIYGHVYTMLYLAWRASKDEVADCPPGDGDVLIPNQSHNAEF